MNMHKDMVTYISVMSNDDLSTLEHIIDRKYRKFTKLYWLLKDFSDYIASLQYKESGDDILKIEALMSKNINIEDVVEQIKSQSSDDYPLTIRHRGNKIKIEITRIEES